MENKTKIILRNLGGLGNQLFIYAFAKSLSAEYGVKVLIDKRSGFPNDPFKRTHKLDDFNINLPYANWFQSLFFVLNSKWKSIARIIFPNSIYLNGKTGIETIIKTITEHKGSIFYLEGYWQTEQYFDKIGPLLKAELLQSKQANKKRTELHALCNGRTPVAVHFRRIEYRLLVDMEYYMASANEIAKQVADPIFIVFSDNPEWSKNHFKTDKPVIHFEGQTDIEDFYLMTQCEHFIVSNSTFAWWGAYLSKNPNKIILAPKKELWPNFSLTQNNWNYATN